MKALLNLEEITWEWNCEQKKTKNCRSQKLNLFFYKIEWKFTLFSFLYTEWSSSIYKKGSSSLSNENATPSSFRFVPIWNYFWAPHDLGAWRYHLTLLKPRLPTIVSSCAMSYFLTSHSNLPKHIFLSKCSKAQYLHENSCYSWSIPS